MRAYSDLLYEHSYSKITVKDIVERCGMHRNSFYYYFEDIPALLNEMIIHSAEKIIHEDWNFSKPQDYLIPTVEFANKHRTQILHIYNSGGKELLVKSITTLARYCTAQYITMTTEDMDISADDLDLLTRFFSAAMVGVVLSWLDDGMRYDVRASALRMLELLEGSSDRAFLKAKRKTPEKQA